MQMQKIHLIAVTLLALGVGACSEQEDITSMSGNVRISWDYNTLQQIRSSNVSNKGYVEQNLYYPRIKSLSDGSLLFSFMNDHFGFDIFVQRSEDGGKTWGDATMLRQRFDTQSSVGNDSKVFVNPDFIELRDGRIMLAYQWRYKDGYNDLEHTNQNCGIEIMFSDDKGKTFGEPRNIYTGRCWEPAMLQLPSGEIQMFITDSNEVMDKLSQPCTIIIRSYDGGQTWQGKESCTYLDGEIISRTFDERGSYDGMPSGVLLDDNYGIAIPLEVWSSKYKMDQTPVIVRTDSEINWHSDQSIRKNGGPEYPYKKQMNKDFIGFGPYSTKLPTGEMIVLTNGSYKNQQGIWVFVGDKKADNFRFATSPFDGYWGSIDYVGNNRVIGTGTVRYKENEKTRGMINIMTGRLNYSKTIIQGDISMSSIKSFDRDNNDYWFLGKETPSSVFSNFGYTNENFILATYLFDEKVSAYTPENSDASVLLINRRGCGNESANYKLVINALGKYMVFKEETASWKLIAKGDSNVELVGTVNDDSDVDLGFAAKLTIDWQILGGKPKTNEVLKLHMRHHYKEASKEAPFAYIEQMQGESGDHSSDWLTLTLK